MIIIVNVFVSLSYFVGAMEALILNNWFKIFFLTFQHPVQMPAQTRQHHRTAARNLNKTLQRQTSVALRHLMLSHHPWM